MIIVSIDVKKLEKDRFIAGKNGAAYCDLVLIENKNGTDNYGNDGFVKQGISKADREAGVEMKIIGNWKHVGQKPAPRQQQRPAPARRPAPQEPDLDGEESEIPF